MPTAVKQKVTSRLCQFFSFISTHTHPVIEDVKLVTQKQKSKHSKKKKSDVDKLKIEAKMFQERESEGNVQLLLKIDKLVL